MDPSYSCNSTDSSELVAQLSGFFDAEDLAANPPNRTLPPFEAVGCLLVVFETDVREERFYGNVDEIGDGFTALYSRDSSPCLGCDESTDACNPNGLCDCNGESWGADCMEKRRCLGTTRLSASLSETRWLASAGDEVASLSSL